MTITALYVDTTHNMDDSVVGRFARVLGLSPIRTENIAQVYEQIKRADDPCAAGKQALVLTANHGPFLRKCPGTREYTCCDYHILNIGTYCTMDCAYCILQSYFHPPLLHFFVNHEDLFAELDQLIDSGQQLRIGTGEFTDSLIWESYSDLTHRLVTHFGRQERSVLELKTKTTAIAGLEGLPHKRKTIVAWSVNTPEVIADQERGTATLKARLRAAAQCQAWGYPLAFHFDPIILYPGCERAYAQVVDAIFGHVSAENIAWISMGTLRFMPLLHSVIQKRFPSSAIIYGEFIPGLDNKMRYFKPLRIKIYKHLMARIRRHAPDLTTYLCMEDDAVWDQSFGFSPSLHGGLPVMLDTSAGRHCGLR
ncbi:MAG: DNA photolyase [Desulfatitalea sp.]|nr:DNA photolyase [Desulfatitalea sp.]NNJ99447.1 DNA photolyase [Desulfatitalea sp.]